ncbi:MAG: ATP-binding protein [Patescibacteria group bacterium]|nr:ATP-binding protein [Patescibacteria group bacterium]
MMSAVEYALEVVEKRRPPLILGLTGPSGVGKTEIIKHLLNQHSFKSTHAGIPVKKGLAEGFNLDWDQVDGSEKNDSSPKLGGVEPKLVLDHMGEALARSAPLATSLALAKKIDKMHREGSKLICVDGVRQQSEADLIKRRGGHIIRVDDGSGPDPKYPMDKRAWKIPADFNIDTSGTIPQARSQVDKIMAKLKLEHPCFTRHSHSDISKDWSQYDQERGAGEKTGRAAGTAAGVYGAGRAFRAVRRIAGGRGLRRAPALVAGAVAGYATYQGAKAAGTYVGRKIDQAVGRVFKGVAGERKVARVMHEWGQGRLRSGSKHGPVVHNQKQAVAIALNQARMRSQ